MNSKRIIAGIIDFFIACQVQAILVGVFLIRPFFIPENSGEMFATAIIALLSTYCAFFYMVVRDIIGKKSIGKLIMKLKIIDKNDGSEAALSKRLLRNVTWFLGPLELFVVLIKKERLGDKIAGTQVIVK